MSKCTQQKPKRKIATIVKKQHKKQNTALFIDGENISPKKVKAILEVAEQQGEIFSQRVYGLQRDKYTSKWSEEARKYNIEDIRLCGGPEKDKVDKKIKRDVKREIFQQKNVDIVCIATSDKGYVETIKELREAGKRVVVIGGKKAPDKLREVCSKFIEV